jgi:tetratricopeptide (TPR) repeat protein
LLEQAISLNPDNDAAWNLCGVAKSQLGDHEGGIEYFTKALEINPENDATRQNLEATEIALASHENAKKPQQEKEEYHEHLRKRARNHKLIFYFLIMLRWLLFICIITIIFAFIVLFAILFLLYVYGGSDSPLRQAIGELNFFTLWPYFMLMFICLMPFFVMLRLNIQDAKRELILEEDFEGRYIVELYLERFFSAEHDRRNFAENISHTGCITTHPKPYYDLIKNHRINLTPCTSTSCVN